ncbi:hypothetical protein LXL81_05825 [Dyadobacter sp. CY356]|nr:hypothetical protein [Dyadobacter sp. CY356]
MEIDRQLEGFADHIMEAAALESTSVDFTSKVMLQALASQKSDVTLYKPLISNSVFAGVLVCFIAAFIYLPENTTPQNMYWLSYPDFSPIYDLAASSVFKFSEMTTYTIVFATLVLFVQICILKKHFDNQFEKCNMQA